MVKKDFNLAMKNNSHSDCENYIKNANLIILFGVSLGETDKHWWSFIGNEMKNRKSLGIIECVHRPNDVPPDRMYLMDTVEQKSKQELLMKLNLSPDDVEGRMFFIINSKMFNV